MEYENEVEIDLFRMLFKACMKWRVIVIVAIIAAVVVGGVKMSMNIAAVMDEEALQETNNDYETKVAAYEAEGKQLELSIEESRRSLQLQKEYNENSMLMKLNPYNEWTGSANLYVDTGYQIMPNSSVQNENPAYKIVYAYSDYAQSGDFYNSLQQKLSFKMADTKYLKELILVSVDGGRYAITVKAVADTEGHCTELLNAVKEILSNQHSEISNKIGEHKLTSTDTEVYSQINTDREQDQITQNTKEAELELSLTNYQTKYLDWKERKKDIEVPILDMGHAIRNGIKFFLIAGVGVGLVMGVCFCLGYIFSAKVQGPESLPASLHRIGEVPAAKTKKFNIIDRAFFGMFGVIAKAEERDARVAASAQHIAQLLEVLPQSENGKKVALVSDIPMANLQALAREMEGEAGEQFEMVVAGNILVSAEASKLVASSAAVVLIVAQGISVKSTIEGIVDQLKSCNRTILGVVVTETDAK